MASLARRGAGARVAARALVPLWRGAVAGGGASGRGGRSEGLLAGRCPRGPSSPRPPPPPGRSSFRSLRSSASLGRSPSSAAAEAAAPFLPPTPLTSLELVSEVPLSTDLLGALLGSTCRRGDTVLLSGGIGAGKSRLARSLIRAAVGDESLAVPSPSYLLRLEYCAEWGGAYDEESSLDRRVEAHDPLRAIVKGTGRDEAAETKRQEKEEEEKRRKTTSEGAAAGEGEGEKRGKASGEGAAAGEGEGETRGKASGEGAAAGEGEGETRGMASGEDGAAGEGVSAAGGREKGPAEGPSPRSPAPPSQSIEYVKPPWEERCTMFDSEEENEWIVPVEALTDPPPPEPTPPPPPSSLVLSHIDLYRLTGPAAATSIARVDLAGAARQGVAIVEWPERLFSAAAAAEAEAEGGGATGATEAAEVTGTAEKISSLGATAAEGASVPPAASGPPSGASAPPAASGPPSGASAPPAASGPPSDAPPSLSPATAAPPSGTPPSPPPTPPPPPPSLDDVLSPSPVSALLSVISPSALAPRHQHEIDTAKLTGPSLPTETAEDEGAADGAARSAAPTPLDPPTPLAPWLPATPACYTPPLNGTLCILVEERTTWEDDGEVDLARLDLDGGPENGNATLDGDDPSTAQTDHESPPAPRVIRLCAPLSSSWRARLGRLRDVVQRGGDGAGLYVSYYEEEEDAMTGEGTLEEDEVPATQT